MGNRVSEERASIDESWVDGPGQGKAWHDRPPPSETSQEAEKERALREKA